jgi:hypothetical protein
MRRVSVLRLACLTAVLLAAGCSSSNKGKIEGTKWGCLAATVKGIAIPAGAISLDFGKDGSLTYRAGPQTYTGTYSLGRGSTVTFHLNQDLAGRKEHAEKIVINGDQLTMTDSDGTQLTFQKAK